MVEPGPVPGQPQPDRPLPRLLPGAGLADFLANPPAGIAGHAARRRRRASRARATSLARCRATPSPESPLDLPERLATNRGNGYLQPFAIGNRVSASQGEVFPSFDCANTTQLAGGGSASGGLGTGQVSAKARPRTRRREGGRLPALARCSPRSVPPRSARPSAFAGLRPSPPTSRAEFGGGRAPHDRARIPSAACRRDPVARRSPAAAG